MESYDIVNMTEVDERLRLDPRAVRQIACEFGDRRVGRAWRFRWGTVKEFFNAYTKKVSW